MPIKVAINGYGRIGRNIVRALYEAGRTNEIQIVAINDLGDSNTNAHLTQYDSVHGKFPFDVTVDGDYIVINGDRIRVLSERDPSKLPWADLNIDVVHECTGFFTSKAKASAHITAGAKKVIISAPGGNDVDGTIVFGVNHHTLKASDTVISNASCTTNCLAPIVKPLNDAIGIESGLMTTIHSYTNDQVLTDVYHSDLRRARSAGKLDGFAMRVPTINVSVVDLTFYAVRSTSVAEINEVLTAASKGVLKGILDINERPLVSVDFNHNPASSIYEAPLTKVLGGRLVKVLSWYDNEWGFSNRMLDTTIALVNAK